MMAQTAGAYQHAPSVEQRRLLLCTLIGSKWQRKEKHPVVGLLLFRSVPWRVEGALGFIHARPWYRGTLPACNKMDPSISQRTRSLPLDGTRAR